MSIPGLDWGMDEVMGKDSKKVPQKKVPYAKPIPAQFQQAWADNKVPMMPPGGDKERKGDPSDPELGFNPQLEQMKMSSDGNMGPPQGSMPPFSGPGGPGGPMPPGQQGFPPNMPPQQMPNNMGPPMQPPFMPPGQMGPPSGPQAHQGPHQGMMGPPGHAETPWPSQEHGTPRASRGPTTKIPEGPRPTTTWAPPERQGGGQDQGSGQGSGPYWGEQQGRRGPQDFEGGQDFHNRAEEGWRPGYRGGHRGGGATGAPKRGSPVGSSGAEGTTGSGEAGGLALGVSLRSSAGRRRASRGRKTGAEAGTLGPEGGPEGGPPEEQEEQAVEVEEEEEVTRGIMRARCMMGRLRWGAPPPCRAWTWPRCPPARDPGRRGRGPQRGRPRGPKEGAPPRERTGGTVFGGGRGGWGPGGPAPRRGGPAPRGPPRGGRGR
ncbi:hypothetical protein CesoFtcFv8_000096 [Champsocephalus esox]|uniref:Uncharacterized protein n=1 Tax=Champsocephalus esox TaxID=159716 RepID=A0AAN8E4V1_9TELE|nr:hypothetical protein CesoFtcFv8_000096 [Champsocephalus esox]